MSSPGHAELLAMPKNAMENAEFDMVLNVRALSPFPFPQLVTNSYRVPPQTLEKVWPSKNGECARVTVGEQYIYRPRRSDSEPRREDRYLMQTDARKEYGTHAVVWFGIDAFGDFGVWAFTPGPCIKTGTKLPGGVDRTFPFKTKAAVSPAAVELTGCWARLATETCCPRFALHALLAAFPGMEIQAVSRGKSSAWLEEYNVDRWAHEFSNQACCVVGCCHTPEYIFNSYLNIHSS